METKNKNAEASEKKVYQVVMHFSVRETRYIYATSKAEALKRAKMGDNDDYAGDDNFEDFLSCDEETLVLNKEKTKERLESIAHAKRQQEIENAIKVGDEVIVKKIGENEKKRRVVEVLEYVCPTGAHAIKVDGDDDEIMPWEWHCEVA